MIDIEHRTLYFESDSVEEFLEFWEKTNAPQNALKAMLSSEVYQQVLTAEAALVDELNESRDGRVKLSSPYILVRALKPIIE